MLRACVAVAAAAALGLGCAAPAAADSYTWGYGYARERVAGAPAGGLAAPTGPAAGVPPFVVPLPGRSQSTPVVVGGRWYLWTYWDGGLRGALWTGTLEPRGGSSPGTAIPLPGQHTAVLSLPAGGSGTFAEPSDAAVSPGGGWVAFGAGARLYWWPAGDPGAGAWAEIAGPGAVEANSTSPTFVPDPRSPGGWDVCDGNWDGGFACFTVGGSGLPEPTATYQVQWTDAADADGYAAITSSAAYGSAGGALYFGVASVHDPRVVALHPHSDAYRVLGSGAIAAPVSAAVALQGGHLYVTDSAGDAYRFGAGSGRLEAVHRGGGGVDIVSPAVDGASLYILGAGRTELLRLDAATLRLRNAGPAGGAPGAEASAPTIAPVPGAPAEVAYAAGGGTVAVVAPDADGGFARLATLPGAPGGTAYDYTAAVVDGAVLLLWSDGGAAGWAGRATEAAAPGAAPRGPGALQVYALWPRLSAAVLPVSATVGGAPAHLTVLAPPGDAVTAAGAPWGRVPLHPAPESGPPCPAGAPPGFGRFPGGTASACGALAGQLPALSAAAAAAAGEPHPAFAGDAPRQWSRSGAGFVAWQGSLPAPRTAGAFAIRVEAGPPGGAAAQLAVWLTAACPSGLAADAAGACTVPTAAGTAGTPPDPACPAGLVAGHDGWTAREYGLLCTPLRPWLVDPAVIGCRGSWWAPAGTGAGGGCAGDGAEPR